MWLQLTKYLFYLSFFLNIVCGVWVFFGIIQGLRDLNKQSARFRRKKAATHSHKKGGRWLSPPFYGSAGSGPGFCSGVWLRNGTLEPPPALSAAWRG